MAPLFHSHLHLAKNILDLELPLSSFVLIFPLLIRKKMKRKLSLFSEQHFWNRIYQNPMVHLLPPSLTLWLRRVSHIVTVKMGKVLLTTAYPLNPPTTAGSCLIFQSFLKEQLGKSRAIVPPSPWRRNCPSPGAKAHHCLPYS